MAGVGLAGFERLLPFSRKDLRPASLSESRGCPTQSESQRSDESEWVSALSPVSVTVSQPRASRQGQGQAQLSVSVSSVTFTASSTATDWHCDRAAYTRFLLCKMLQTSLKIRNDGRIWITEIPAFMSLQEPENETKVCSYIVPSLPAGRSESECTGRDVKSCKLVSYFLNIFQTNLK